MHERFASVLTARHASNFLIIAFLLILRSLNAAANNLRCQGALPTREALTQHGLDPDLLNSYLDVETLCKFEPMIPGRRSLGCICWSEDFIHRCLPGLANPYLYTVNYLFSFCYLACSCPRQQLNAQREDELADGASSDFESIASSDPTDNLLAKPYMPMQGGDTSSSLSDDYQDYDDFSDISSELRLSNALARSYRRRRKRPPKARSGTCATKCDGNFRCGNRDSGCHCLAVPDIVTKGLWHMRGCVAAAVSGLGGRSLTDPLATEHWACPCNASYVSQTCCDAEDNLVWEAASEKLGVLA